MLEFIESNALVLVLSLLAVVILLVVLLIAINVKRTNKWREKEFENNRDMEMLKVRIDELEKESAQLHEHETQLLSERDSILMAAHEKADDILEQTMERVQKSEAQIRQNRIIASCTITDARRRISDLMIEVSKRLVVEDGGLLDAEKVTPEAVEAAEAEEKVAASDFERALESAAEPAEEAEQPEEEAAEPETAEEPEAAEPEETVTEETAEEEPEETPEAEEEETAEETPVTPVTSPTPRSDGITL